MDPYRKEYIKKDGTIVPVELNGFIIENYNGVKGIFSLIEDVSSSAAAELHFSKLASLGELASGVGHRHTTAPD